MRDYNNNKEPISLSQDTDAYFKDVTTIGNEEADLEVMDALYYMDFFGITHRKDLALVKKGILEILKHKKEDRKIIVKEERFMQSFNGKIKNVTAFTAFMTNILKISDSQNLDTILENLE